MPHTLSIEDYLALPTDPMSFLVEGLIPTQSFTVLWGPPKSGKTLLALSVGLAIANKTPVLGNRTQQGPVLVLQLDTAQPMFRNMLTGLRAVQGLTGPLYLPHPDDLRLHYPLNLLHEASSLYLHSLISEVKPALVIIDCLSELGNHDENEQQEMKPIISALKHVTTFHPTNPCAVLLIHHTVKFEYQNKQQPIPSPLKAGRGSGYLAGAADSIWFLHKVSSDDDPRGILKVVPRFTEPSTYSLLQGAKGWWSMVS